MEAVLAGVSIDALAAELAYTEVPQEHRPAAGTETGHAQLGAWAGNAVGVWEMGVGRMEDVEQDELCIIISGEGEVAFVEPELPTVQLRAGSVLALSAGMRTVWTVTGEPLRKVYVA